jgi:uncharacterized protein (TIGR00255 family)
MIRSMTGYSKAQGEEAGLALSVSVKSTNHRFLDVQVRLPAALEPLDHVVRHLVKACVMRGHVEVTITLDWRGVTEPRLDQKLLAAYVTAFQRLRSEFGSASEPDLVGLLRVPGMVTASNGELSPEETERAQGVLQRVTNAALGRLNEMRAQEGQALEHDVRDRLARLAALSESIGQLAQHVPQLHRQRLENRIQELSAGTELDPLRLAQEIAYLAARSDIAEELTRFRSHLQQAQSLLEESVETGKKLDFLLQEMNREANTLLSKTTDVPEIGPEIARQAIEMKTEIEKLREQAQNIE